MGSPGAPCVFCKIAKGDIPSHKVYEDEVILAFLDIRPLTVGHALVIPKRHVESVSDLTPDQSGAIGRAVREVARRVRAGTGAPGATIAINDGAAAGQEVPHVHVHVVPRSPGDGFGPIHALFLGHAPKDPGDFAALAARMRSS